MDYIDNTMKILFDSKALKNIKESLLNISYNLSRKLKNHNRD